MPEHSAAPGSRRSNGDQFGAALGTIVPPALVDAVLSRGEQAQMRDDVARLLAAANTGEPS